MYGMVISGLIGEHLSKPHTSEILDNMVVCTFDNVTDSGCYRSGSPHDVINIYLVYTTNSSIRLLSYCDRYRHALS